MSVDLKNLKSISVLYVEDDDLIRNQTKSMFDNLFKEVFVAENGKLGFELFQECKDKIDVVVSDINMPVMDGLTMSSMIRDIDKDRAIVLTTAYTDEDFLLRSLEVNIDKYITKPLKIKELATAILDVVQKRKKTAGLAIATKNLANINAEINKEKSTIENALELAQSELAYANDIISNYVSWFKVDKKGSISWVSNKFLKLYEYDLDEVLGIDVSNLKHTECDAMPLQKQMLEAVYNKKAMTGRHIFTAKNGNKVECETTVIPIYGSSGLVEAYFFYQDIIHS